MQMSKKTPEKSQVSERGKFTFSRTGGISAEPNVVRKYMQYLKLERNFTPNTLAAYQHDLERLLRFCEAEGIGVLDVNIDHLHAFAAQLHEDHIGPKSQARILSGTRAFFRYLVLEDYIRQDPTELLEWPTLPQHLPEVLTTAEIDRIEDSIDLSHPQGHRNRAIIEVLFSCGLRVSELVNLQISNIFEQERFVRIMGKGRKERLVPISERAIHELHLWYADRNLMAVKPGEEDYVFLNRRGSRLTRTMILIMIKQQALEAGITKTISPHTFRHSFATELLKGGADLRVIQVMLGHEGIRTTEMYTHLDTTTLREEILLHHPRNNPRKA